MAPSSPITITNSGNIATTGLGAIGIEAATFARSSSISIVNSGGISTRALNGDGVNAATTGRNSDLSVVNSGDIFTRGEEAEGVFATTVGRNAGISINNSGTINTRGRFAEGINAATYGTNGDLSIVNSGDIETRGFLSDGIYAATFSENSALTIVNSGTVRARGVFGYGIYAQTYEPSSPIEIQNSGEIYGTTVGIYTYSATSTTITNSGSISAGSGLAIDTEGASTTINNTGLITGFIDLTGNRDIFNNNGGGEFNAMQTSYFGGGGDVFINNSGATLRTADNRNNSEFTSFEGLEQFKNRGVITMQDGKQGDVFMISNTVGGTDLSFDGSGDSTLKVDTFLGGPKTSKSDILIVEGDVTGKTLVQVLNTNPGAAQLDRKGIPVVFVEGDVNKSNFYLEKPIDAGFFDYDLIFRPTGSGVFELKNHPGGGSHILPHVVTFTHDTFHNTTETWFDQSTDLRALLAEGSVCNDPARRQDVVRCQQLYNFTPGVWVRGAGAWLDLEDNATTKANGKTYRYNLDRELDIWTFETGIDFGKRDLFADGDILVFGVLGGAVESSLEYKSLSRNFHLGGAEAGAYATYLNGGLFVDTLFKAQFLKLDPSDVRGFPDKLDSTTYGFRTDTGYRFGGVRHGPFFEPLATIAVSWNETDDFALDGNAHRLQRRRGCARPRRHAARHQQRSLGGHHHGALRGRQPVGQPIGLAFDDADLGRNDLQVHRRPRGGLGRRLGRGELLQPGRPDRGLRQVRLHLRRADRRRRRQGRHALQLVSACLMRYRPFAGVSVGIFGAIGRQRATLSALRYRPLACLSALALAALHQRVADFLKQHHLLRRRRLGRRGFLLLAAQPVHRLDHQEQDEGDDGEADHAVDEQADIHGRRAGLPGLGQGVVAERR